MISETENTTWQKKYYELLEKTAGFGINAYGQLSQVQKDRLLVMEFLREKHGNIKYSPHTIHKLPQKLKQECRDVLHVQFADNPNANRRIDEVFAKPRRSRVRREKAWYI
jgi:hypothetical protein